MTDINISSAPHEMLEALRLVCEMVERPPEANCSCRNSANDYTFTQAIASAKAAGVEPPVDMVEQLAAWQQAGLASAVEAKKAELAKAEQALAEAIANSKVHA